LLQQTLITLSYETKAIQNAKKIQYIFYNNGAFRFFLHTSAFSITTAGIFITLVIFSTLSNPLADHIDL